MKASLPTLKVAKEAFTDFVMPSGSVAKATFATSDVPKVAFATPEPAGVCCRTVARIGDSSVVSSDLG